MVKTVTRRRSSSPMAVKLAQYLSLQKVVKDTNKDLGDLKKELIEYVDQYHTEDPEKGHLLHTLPEVVEFLGQRFTGFQKQRKVSQVFLEDEAEKLCQEKEFDLDDYTTRYVDQDKIVRLFAEDKITQEEFDRLYESSVTWAFLPTKE